MIDMESYKSACNFFLQLLRKGRGGIYLGGYEVMGANVFAQEIITDSRHFASLKTLYVPSPVESSVLALMVKLIKPGMVVADVGAGCGYYTVIAASSVAPTGKVYSFEMIPECFKLLEKNVEINELQTVRCVNALVSDAAGTEKHSYFGGNYEFFFLNASEVKEQTIDVETVYLDKYFEDKEPVVDFVKININSHLPRIFKGMSDLLLFNPEIKILAQFNKEKTEAAGENLKEFLDDVEKKRLEIFLLPTLKPVSKEELLDFTTEKTILIAKEA